MKKNREDNDKNLEYKILLSTFLEKLFAFKKISKLLKQTESKNQTMLPGKAIEKNDLKESKEFLQTL